MAVENKITTTGINYQKLDGTHGFMTWEDLRANQNAPEVFQFLQNQAGLTSDEAHQLMTKINDTAYDAKRAGKSISEYLNTGTDASNPMKNPWGFEENRMKGPSDQRRWKQDFGSLSDQLTNEMNARRHPAGNAWDETKGKQAAPAQPQASTTAQQDTSPYAQQLNDYYQNVVMPNANRMIAADDKLFSDPRIQHGGPAGSYIQGMQNSMDAALRDTAFANTFGPGLKQAQDAMMGAWNAFGSAQTQGYGFQQQLQAASNIMNTPGGKAFVQNVLGISNPASLQGVGSQTGLGGVQMPNIGGLNQNTNSNINPGTSAPVYGSQGAATQGQV